jgi:hypothetical protein
MVFVITINLADGNKHASYYHFDRYLLSDNRPHMPRPGTRPHERFRFAAGLRFVQPHDLGDCLVGAIVDFAKHRDGSPATTAGDFGAI